MNRSGKPFASDPAASVGPGLLRLLALTLSALLLGGLAGVAWIWSRPAGETVPPPAGLVAGQLPSGQQVELIELRLDTQENDEVRARARYLAPALGAGLAFDAVEGDFAILCQDRVLQMLAERDVAATQVIVSLSSAPVAFGETAPGITQFFEVFRVQDGLCIWDGY